MLQINQLTPEVRVGSLHGQRVGLVQPMPDLCIQAPLILVIVRESAVDLSEREMRVLKVNLLRGSTRMRSCPGRLR